MAQIQAQKKAAYERKAAKRLKDAVDTFDRYGDEADKEIAAEGKTPHLMRKVVAALFIGAVVTGVLLGDGHILPQQKQNKQPPVFYEVEYGDTLWSIAEQYRDSSEDVREVYWRIMKDNHADAGNLHVGQELIINR